MPVISKHLSNISNDKVVLVKFTNYKGKYDTGYASWLVDVLEDQISEKIKRQEELVMYWPNEKVQEANNMKKLKGLKFKKETVIVISQGVWTNMRSELASINTKGIKNTTKDGRKKHSAKIDNDFISPFEITKDKKAKRISKNVEKDRQNAALAKQDEALYNLLIAKQKQDLNQDRDRSEDDNVEDVVESKKRKLNEVANDAEDVGTGDDTFNITQSKKKKACYDTSSEEEDEFFDDKRNSTKPVVQHKDDETVDDKSDGDGDEEDSTDVDLDLDDEEAEKKMEELRLKIETDIEVVKLKDEIQYLEKNLAEKTSENEILKQKLSESESQLQSSLVKINKLEEEKKDTFSTSAKKSEIERELEQLGYRYNNLREMLGMRSDKREVTSSAPVLDENISDLTSSNLDRSKSDLNTPPGLPNVEEMGNNVSKNEKYIIPKEILKQCNHRTVETLCLDLLRLMFTPKELASSSLTGKLSNNAKVHTPNAVPRPALNQEKLNALKDYCLEHSKGERKTNKSLMNMILRRKVGK